MNASLREVVTCVDALVRSVYPLAAHSPEEHELSRQRPQLSRYGESDAFARHCDNYCPLAGDGPHCNGRWLTAVYYTSEGWSEDHGGCLRLFKPQGDASSTEGEPPMPGATNTHASATGATELPAGIEFEDDALLDVAPLADRLLLFYSDFRCPHAVQVVGAGEPRYAVTVWFNQRRREA